MSGSEDAHTAVAPEPFALRNRTRRTGVSRAARMMIAIGCATLLGIVLVVLWFTVVPGAQLRWHDLGRSVLSVRVIGGPLMITVYSLSILCLGALCIRRWRWRSLTVTVCGVVLAGCVTAGVLWYVDANNVFGVALDAVTWRWSIVALTASAFALSGVFWGRWWRRLIAGISVIVFCIAGGIGINADFGLDKTIADLAGVSLAKPIHLPRPAPTAPALSSGFSGPLWESWNPPKDMPKVGQTGQVVIPATVSGFHSRPAGIYLPPAALVADAPRLPLVVMLMGQPGNPDPSYIATVLNGFAAEHKGLAPIVVVADQLGNPAIDTLCLDTPQYGNVQTFLSVDVVNWARANLHILEDPAHWVVAGYSNGGECALSLGARYPNIWGNVLDISGEAYPGSDHSAKTLAEIFHNDKSAYRAVFPETILAQQHYSNTVAVFTAGSDDDFYRAQAHTAMAAAEAAGWVSTYYEVPNGGHVLKALMGGLEEGFSVLYPRLELSQPVTASTVSNTAVVESQRGVHERRVHAGG